MAATRHSRVPAVSSHGAVRRGPRVSVRVDDGMVTLVVSGDMDALAAALFVAELRQLSAICVGTLTVDLTACDEISTAVLGALEAVHAACGSGRCRLAVLARHPDITTALRRAGIPRPV
jgi:anti-anti-sigma regulatory factor